MLRRSIRWLPLWCCLARLAANGQTPAAPLSKIQQKVLEDITRLPNYTCTETIVRSSLTAVERAFQVSDRVRIAVGFVGGKETYGWPGGETLDQDDLTKLVAGTISSGDFAVRASALFTSDHAEFSKVGKERRAGRAAVHYDYRVPLEATDWILRVEGKEARIGYHGSFWIDDETLDLMELNIQGDDIPQALKVRAVERNLQYKRVRIGSDNFLLPARAVLIARNLAGDVMRNETEFRDCRQYAVESVIRFEDTGSQPEPVGEQAASVAIELPPLFEVELALESEIDSNVSAVGDPFTARLIGGINAGGQTVVSKGALLHGRVVRLEYDKERRSLDLAFSYVEAGGRRINLRDRVNRLEGQSGFGKHRPGPIVVDSPRLRLARGSRLFLISAAK